MMRRAFIPAVVAILVTGGVIWELAAALYHSIFFYKADGVMSPETAKCLGLMKDDRAPFSAELAFRKSEAEDYFYREGGTIAFIDETSYTNGSTFGMAERLKGIPLKKSGKLTRYLPLLIIGFDPMSGHFIKRASVFPSS